MMNIAMPSIVIKMMRQKFDQQWAVRKTHANTNEQGRVLRMLREGALTLEARLWKAPTMTIGDLLRLSEGHLVMFDHPVGTPRGTIGKRNSQIYRANGEHGQEESPLRGGV